MSKSRREKAAAGESYPCYFSSSHTLSHTHASRSNSFNFLMLSHFFSLFLLIPESSCNPSARNRKEQLCHRQLDYEPEVRGKPSFLPIYIFFTRKDLTPTTEGSA